MKWVFEMEFRADEVHNKGERENFTPSGKGTLFLLFQRQVSYENDTRYDSPDQRT